jgi:hypothetical protein
MFSNRFAFAMPALGASLRQDELRGEGLLVLRSRFEGGVIDESLHRPCAMRGATWSRARFVFEGPLHAGQDVRAGQLVVTRFGDPARSLAPSSDWMELVWPCPTETPNVSTLSPRSLARARALAAAMEGNDLAVMMGALEGLLADLRAHGLFITAPSHDERAARFARTLWQRAMELERQPMAVDLASALGVSERHALRQASRYLERFHLSASSWRELMQCLRVEMGTFFMSARNATTEAVSRYLGFASPTGLCHAFQDAGLPSPQVVHHELA